MERGKYMNYYIMGTPCETLPNNLCGIYLIRNKVNNKIYIGQSIDIKRRIQEHYRSAHPEKYSIKSERDSNLPIHRAMQHYGTDEFSVNVLELCEQKDLNDKERSWVSLLRSSEREIGYNLTEGGQKTFALKGEKHSQAKLNSEQAEEVKKLLRENKLTNAEIARLFNISNATISMINQGKVWNYNNDDYPLRKNKIVMSGERNPNTIITNEEVMEMRILFSQEGQFKTIIEKYSNKYSFSLIRSVIYGEAHKDLPIWDNKNKVWK